MELPTPSRPSRRGRDVESRARGTRLASFWSEGQGRPFGDPARIWSTSAPWASPPTASTPASLPTPARERSPRRSSRPPPTSRRASASTRATSTRAPTTPRGAPSRRTSPPSKAGPTPTATPREWPPPRPSSPWSRPGSGFVVSDNVYGGTHRFFTKILSRYGVEFAFHRHDRRRRRSTRRRATSPCSGSSRPRTRS